MNFFNMLFGERTKSIFTSIEEGNIEELKKYINNNESLKIKHDDKGLLNFAIDSCENNYDEIIELLINNGADINSNESYFMETPLHRICARVKPRIHLVKLFLEKGANVNAVSKTGKTPVFYCIFSYSVELLNLLVKYGADVNITDKYGNTLLHDDYINCNEEFFQEFLKTLINYGFNVNSKNNAGHSPLDMCKNHFIEKILLKHGAVRLK